MPRLDSLRTLVEWAISGLCLLGSAALFVQQDWFTATVLFSFGWVINPPLKANNLIKACLTLLTFIVLLGR